MIQRALSIVLAVPAALLAYVFLRLSSYNVAIGRLQAIGRVKFLPAGFKLHALASGRTLNTLGHLLPGVTCLVKAAAMNLLLSWTNCKSAVHLGVGRVGSSLHAHAWLEVDGHATFGFSADVDYVPLSRPQS
jgi:predicted membrane protein